MSNRVVCGGIAPIQYKDIRGLAFTSPAEMGLLSDLLPSNGKILEIGTASGATIVELLRRRADVNAVCVDTFVGFPNDNVETGVTHYANWLHNSKLVADRIKLTPRESLSGEKFNVVLVDGNHVGDHPYLDTTFASDLLVEGGVIVVHDYNNDNWPSVNRDVHRFCEGTDFRVADLVDTAIVLRKVPKERPTFKDIYPPGIPVRRASVCGSSWVTEKELDALVELLPEEGYMLELGTASGATAAEILRRRPSARALCVDLFFDGFREEANSESGEIHLIEWLRNERIIAGRMRLWLGCGGSLLPLLDSPKFDLVFVDGDHTLDGVRTDLETAKQLVKSDGKIVVHDYGNHQLADVTLAVNEFAIKHGYAKAKLAETLVVLQPAGEVTDTG